MGLYDKYARLAGERLQFSDNGLTPFGTCIDEVYSATEGRGAGFRQGVGPVQHVWRRQRANLFTHPVADFCVQFW